MSDQFDPNAPQPNPGVRNNGNPEAARAQKMMEFGSFMKEILEAYAGGFANQVNVKVMQPNGKVADLAITPIQAVVNLTTVGEALIDESIKLRQALANASGDEIDEEDSEDDFEEEEEDPPPRKRRRR
jgi:hypothetical protein